MTKAKQAGVEGRDAVVRSALVTFWQKGAEATSYNDIVEATGLSRRALYALWPDKDALVHEAMVLYRRLVLGPLIDQIGLGGRIGLEGFWGVLTDGVRTPGWAGCFLFRSASGALRGDPVIAAYFDDHARLLRTGITRAVREAMAEGSLDREVDPDAAGWQTLAIASLLSTYGALSGNSEAVAKLIGAGRIATGLTAGSASRGKRRAVRRPDG